MEHRYTKRFEMTFDTFIYCCDNLVLRGKTRNISIDGLFIELCDCRFDRNTIVGVACMQDGHLCARQKAIVIHVSSKGVGLMLEESSKMNIKALQAICRPGLVITPEANACV